MKEEGEDQNEEEEGMVLRRRSTREVEEMRVMSMVCNPQG